jgi:hypothetical protein
LALTASFDQLTEALNGVGIYVYTSLDEKLSSLGRSKSDSFFVASIGEDFANLFTCEALDGDGPEEVGIEVVASHG